MKLVINSCYGGFSLSPNGIRRMAELQGRPCHFFSRDGFRHGSWIPADPDSPSGIASMMLTAFDIPNPNDVLPNPNGDAWVNMTEQERDAWNEAYEKHCIDSSPERTDVTLIKTVEELGSEAASGSCAKLKVIEIPDGIQWEIEEYDGFESVHEKHASWA